jgi:hypothetical protein
MAAFDQFQPDPSPQGEDSAAASIQPARDQMVGDRSATMGLSPELTRLIADEVARQLALSGHQDQASSDTLGSTVGVKEMMAKMPPGLRSESSVRRAIEAGTIPARKIGARWALDPKAVTAVLMRNESAGQRVSEFKATWQAKEKALKRGKFGQLFHKNNRKKCEIFGK